MTSRFQERLWRDLVREHGAALAQIAPPAPPRRRARPGLVVGTTGALAGLGTTLALVLGATGTSPAFAVTHNADGTVSVTINRMDGIRAANAKLAALGLPVRAVPVTTGCTTAVTEPPPNVSASPAPVRVARIEPRAIPHGDTLLLADQQHGQRLRLVEVRGAVPACLLKGVPGGVQCVPGAPTGDTTAPASPPTTNEPSAGATQKPVASVCRVALQGDHPVRTAARAPRAVHNGTLIY
ncbi:MAG TPA: hypothetical protein VHX88_09330 [Solirubrobacteraceae bacterium]|jgi:hypothetical protein|nr:hypothetical protein [Solirubrobacteraceae bacterium]